MKRIFTHFNVDLDAVASVWAVKTFIAEMSEAEVQFKPANWDGSELQKEDIAVDISAGGKGVKGESGENGIVHSCFAYLIKNYASPEDQKALANLVDFVDAQDAHGLAVNYFIPEVPDKEKFILASTGINAVLRAFQAFHPNNDLKVIEKMSEIFTGLLYSGRARQKAEIEANSAEILEGGKVAIVSNAKQFATNGILYDRGVQAIIYVDGNNLGLIRSNKVQLSMSHPEIKAVVEETGELNEWFAHPAGFLFCRGSRKAPAETKSKVEPKKIADKINSLL